MRVTGSAKVGGNGGPRVRPRRRTVAQQVKDAVAADLRIKGHEIRDIQKALGLRAPSAAYAAVKRGLNDRRQWKFDPDDTLTIALAMLYQEVRGLNEIMEAKHYIATPSGRLVMMRDPETGEDVPVPDPGPKLRAFAELRQIASVLVTMSGLRPPVTEDDVDAEIKKLSKEIAAAQDSSAAPPE